MLAADQAGEVFRLLRGGAPARDLVDAQVRMRPVAQPDARRGAADLLDRDDVREIAETRAPVGLGHRDAVQPQVAELAP